MKEPQKFRMQDIFHQESFSEIRKEDGKLRPHSLFKDTIGIHIHNKECRRAQHPLSSKYVVIFISSFYSQLLVYFIDLLSWFAWLVSLYGPKRSCDLSDKRDLSSLLSDWVWGRGICADVGEGMFESK